LVLDLAKRASFAIENSRLYKNAQEANQAKSSFLANMSHEIRTPLGAMLGFAELLAEDTLSTRQHDQIEIVLRNGRQLLLIVDEVLDLAKVESERIEIKNIEFSLPEMISEIMSLMRLRAEERGLNLNLGPLDNLPEKIISDPTRFRQILMNVIGNA